MKKTVIFKEGDKVFAKIKGYPTWPAEVVSKEGRRFKVRFYGTGEIGVIKAEDICYYLKNKSNYFKSIRRKDYNEAFDEIEEAIKACGGTDGDTQMEPDTDLPSDSSLNESVTSKRASKRKRVSSSQASTETVQSKKKCDESEPDVPAKSDTLPLPQNNPQEVEKELEAQETEAVATANATEQLDALLEVNEGESYVNVIPDEYLHAVITYEEHLKQSNSTEDKPVEPREEVENEIVVAKLPTGKYIGLKYTGEIESKFSSELQQAEYEAHKARTFLALKKSIEEGKINPETEPLSYISLNLNENEIQQAIQLKLIERKKRKLKWLKIESSLVELDSKIKSCLGLDRAEPKQALDYLDQILELPIEPLMLIKHSHVVEMVRRLRRYIGNVKEWNLSEENLKEFQGEAESIRKKAEDVYKKIMDIMKIGGSTNFSMKFSELCEQFKTQTKDLKESEIFALCSNPDSRRTFLDHLEEEDEKKIMFETDKPNRIAEDPPSAP